MNLMVFNRNSLKFGSELAEPLTHFQEFVELVPQAVKTVTTLDV